MMSMSLNINFVNNMRKANVLRAYCSQSFMPGVLYVQNFYESVKGCSFDLDKEEVLVTYCRTVSLAVVKKRI